MIPRYRVFMIPTAKSPLLPPSFSAWFIDATDAQEIARRSAGTYDAIAVVEYPSRHGSAVDILTYIGEIEDWPAMRQVIERECGGMPESAPVSRGSRAA